MDDILRLSSSYAKRFPYLHDDIIQEGYFWALVSMSKGNDMLKVYSDVHWAIRSFLRKEKRAGIVKEYDLVIDNYDDFIDRLKGNEKLVAQFLVMGTPVKEIFKVVPKREFYEIKEALAWILTR